MAQARVATELDRLPWLKDETKPIRIPSRGKGGGGFGQLLIWGLAALLVVAGASFWAGFNRPSQESAPADPLAGPAATVMLPEAENLEAIGRPEAFPEAQPERSTPAPSLQRAEPVRVTSAEPARKAARRRIAPARSRTKAARARSPAKPAVTIHRPHTAWESAGAAGQVVRVGVFSSRRQAKRGWSAIARAYPITRLPAVVVGAPSMRNGRTYYRLQIGTTSQAHSEVLCQRMRIIGQSCVVVGLSGKA